MTSKTKTTNQKIARRSAGIPLNISLKPRPTEGNDLAGDIFRAVKNDEEAEKVRRKVESAEKTSVSEVAENPPVEENTVETPPIRQPTVSNPQKLVSIKQSMVQLTDENEAVNVVKVPRKVSFDNSAQSLSTEQFSPEVTELFEKSKARELYELLLQLTHEASQPAAKVRVPRSFLMAQTNIKTRITLDLNLRRLENVGLLKIDSRPGEQEGNLYEVRKLDSPTNNQRPDARN